MKRKLIIALALCLALALGIGGTMAYLTASSKDVVNTFTIGKVGLDLFETKLDKEGNKQHVQDKDYTIVPGETVDKDPTVVVTEGSEPCWVFVKVTEDLGDLKDAVTAAKIDFFSYSLTNTWQKLTGVDGVENVYFCTVEGNKIGTEIPVLNGDNDKLPNGVVTLSDGITQEMSDILANKTNAKAPTLTFKAAAVQKANVADEKAAYNSLPDAFKAD